MERDREKTKIRIFKALAALLAESGFGKVGINAVAQRAGVDKVLIYRYFGGMKGLLSAFAEWDEFWPNLESLASTPEVADDQSGTALSIAVLAGYIRTLRSNTLTREILRWELMEKNELTDALAEYRERQGLQFLEQCGTRADIDLPALASILYAGIIYLSLRSKTITVFNGIDITSDEGWERIERSIAFLVDTVMRSYDPEQNEKSK